MENSQKNNKFSHVSIVGIDVPMVEIILVVNSSPTKLRNFLLSKSVKKDIIDDAISLVEDKNLTAGSGFYSRADSGCRILWLKEFEWTNECLDVLCHEVFHFTDWEAEYRGFEREPEFKAYLYEATNRKIRKLLGEKFSEFEKRNKQTNNMACKSKKKKK